MKHIKVLFYATIREATGISEFEIDLPDESTITDLKTFLAERFPKISRAFPTTIVTVNQECVQEDYQLAHNSGNSIFPPCERGKLSGKNARMNSMKIVCSNCHEPYPQDSLPYLCKKCGAIYDVVSLDVYEKKTEFQKNPGIWRYKNLLNLPKDTAEISLGEGNTPLIFDRVNGYEVGFKLEFMNPTGSYKDRGSSVLVSQLVNFGVKSAVED